MSPNILATPGAIAERILAVCPDATIEGEVTGTGFALRCTLVAGYRTFFISHQLDAQAFEKGLKERLDEILFNQKTSSRIYVEPEFDITRYSLVPHLSGWKEFQRTLFRQRGLDYETILKTYLSNEDAISLQQLMQVGFAPSQLTRTSSEEELSVFTTLCDNLKRTKDPAAQRIFANLEKHYPTIFSAVVERMKQKFVRPVGETPYQSVLRSLTSRVIGQDKAAQLLATAVASQQTQGGNQKFMFVGPTGIGKTEMAKAVAAIKENRFLMLPMNQYMQETSVSNLFGSSPGYVGSTDKPHFAKELEKFHPVKKGAEGNTQIYEVENVVILFDELEKAHSKIKQSLLALFDEAYCLVQYTSGAFGGNVSEKYVFKKTLFIATSNLYAPTIIGLFKESKDPQEIAKAFITLNIELPSASSFSPEFLGRFKIIPFGPIPKGAAYQALLELKMNEQLPVLKSEFSCEEVKIVQKPQILQILENCLYGEGVDLRRVKIFFESNVKNVIYSQIIEQCRIDLSQAAITMAPYQGRLLGVKATASILGKLEDLTPLFPVII